MSQMKTRYDVVIVGAGHNGLTCGAFLARAGLDVAVLESRDLVGGFCTTEETVPEAPGYRMYPFSMDHVFTNVPPSVIDQLELHRHGVEWLVPDPFYSYLSPDGATIAFWQDHRRTVEEIRRLSPRDADRYDRFVTVLREFWQVVMPYLQGHPRRVAPRDLVTMARHGARNRKSLATAARIMLAPADSVIEEWFERDELRAMLACYAATGFSRLEEQGSAIVLAMLPIMHGWGVRRPVGGNGSFTGALARCLLAHGGEIHTSTAVDHVVVRDGRAAGVVTADGREVGAGEVISAVDPWTTMRRLLAPEHVPPEVDDELRGMALTRNNITGFKGDVALSRAPSLPRHGREDELLPSCIFLASSLESVREALEHAALGLLTEDVPLWVVTPSRIDRSLVPPGSDGETLYVYLPAVPWELAGGEDWAGVKDKHLERSLNIWEEYAPGTRDSVIGTYTASPQDLASISGVAKGHLFHVDMTLHQIGPWRPTPSLSGYRTPVEGLWHTAAGAHPMGALNGWSGRTTAGEVLRARRRGPGPLARLLGR